MDNNSRTRDHDTQPRHRVFDTTAWLTAIAATSTVSSVTAMTRGATSRVPATKYIVRILAGGRAPGITLIQCLAVFQAGVGVSSKAAQAFCHSPPIHLSGGQIPVAAGSHHPLGSNFFGRQRRKTSGA
eukprot:scaffold5186_cov35-Tisochrysis_lutea.AAC.1